MKFQASTRKSGKAKHITLESMIDRSGNIIGEFTTSGKHRVVKISVRHRPNIDNEQDIRDIARFDPA